MKIAIFGGGFGLYGYLPALIACGCEVALPARYRERVASRDDIRALAARVEWGADDDAMLRRCDGVVVALPPAEQRRQVERCLAHENIRHLLLEKPLDVSPALADALLDGLERSGRGFAIGYHFRHTGWGKALLRDGRGARRIGWRFRAHHYAHDVETWKRRPAEGGGALRFYGVHLVALMAELGYDSAAESETVSARAGEPEAWRATLTGDCLPECRVEVDSDSDAVEFTVQDRDGGMMRLSDPFSGEAIAPNGADRRIPILAEAAREALASPHRDDGLYRKVGRLWASIEAVDRRRGAR
jgi:predicted dehydrogenase